MAWYARTDGVLVEPLGHLWVAFSPSTGQTLLLNDEGAAVLEVLTDGPTAEDRVCEVLAADSGQDSVQLRRAIDECWLRLIEAGLVRQVAAPIESPAR